MEPGYLEIVKSESSMRGTYLKFQMLDVEP
jgi:hypothetical protein